MTEENTEDNIVYDLTEVVRGAKRGRYRDVEHLCQFLDKGKFFIPLQETTTVAKSGIQVGDDQWINPHLIQHPDGPLYGTICTSSAMVKILEDKLQWKTEGGPLQFARTPATMALNVILKLMEEEKIMGLIINPYDDSNLILNAQEVDALVNNAPIPFVAYAHASPMGPDESMRIIRREDPFPDEFVSIVEDYTSSHDELESCEIVESFNAERDIEPNILINLKTTTEECDFSSIASVLIEKTRNILEPARNIIIFFNEDLPEAI